VSQAQRATRGIRETLVHIGQHYDRNMSDVFSRELGIPRSDKHLGIGSGTHGAQTGRVLEALERAMPPPGAYAVACAGSCRASGPRAATGGCGGNHERGDPG
jgi:hypothetical protein